MEKSLIQEHIPLKNKNWFQTGGQARFLAEPATVEQFAQSLNFANKNGLELFILGEGANILISDDGFDGLVIKPGLQQISHQEYDRDHELVHAQAGVSIEILINYCLENNIIGLEEFSGIPGTVGGSAYINIHYFQFFLSDFLHEAQIIHKQTGNIETVTKDWFNFGYDTSKLFEKEYFLVQATFKLKKVTPLESAYAAGRSVEIIRHRNARYPNTHTCGSFFRNFFDSEVILTIAGTNKKMIYVAYYLDKIGVKGNLSVGDASVSHKHANMLINTGNATSTDIVNLAKQMQQLVQKKFRITPQPECQLIGFKEYPLL